MRACRLFGAVSVLVNPARLFWRFRSGMRDGLTVSTTKVAGEIQTFVRSHTGAGFTSSAFCAGEVVLQKIKGIEQLWCISN